MRVGRHHIAEGAEHDAFPALGYGFVLPVAYDVGRGRRREVYVALRSPWGVLYLLTLGRLFESFVVRFTRFDPRRPMMRESGITQAEEPLGWMTEDLRGALRAQPDEGKRFNREQRRALAEQARNLQLRARMDAVPVASVDLIATPATLEAFAADPFDFWRPSR